ncbi:sigma 54-interacting transcriptional regulator [candidate division CSSED10-310 bacterium]|uniref:Sigma 54-interacting transcriptional regulator n=1 Tax=candidate division CSSED10-310 bacterium TaxID=2855610 RepID=A0ABV6YSK4_UNCC1
MEKKIIDNRYEVDHLLGQGLWGEVYKVLDLSNHQSKALKIITNLKSDHTSGQWLKDEFRRLIKLKHQNVITVFDFGFATRDIPYFTMEYMDGGHLKLESAAYNEQFIVAILSRLCAGLQYIHSRGYIHGDMKPENVLLASHYSPGWQTGNTLNAKIADFSLADFNVDEVLPEKSDHSPLQGTFSFMAPEKFFNRRIDYRVDLFSLGVLLYQQTTGYLPFNGETAAEIINAIITRHPVPPSRFNNKISEKLEYIILRLLEKEPFKRFQSAREVLNILGLMPASPGKHYLLELSDCSIIGDKFVGRESEIVTAKELLEQASDGQGQAFFVFGETGIGKSRFIKELRVSAQLNGFKVALTTCKNGKTFSHQFLAELLRQLGLPEKLDQLTLSPILVDRLQKIIAPRETEIAGNGESSLFGEDDSNFESSLLFEAILRFIENMCLSEPEKSVTSVKSDSSDHQPLFLCIEDLHRAHSVILDFCQFLVRNLAHLPLLFCATFNDEEIIMEGLDKSHPLMEMQQQSERRAFFHSLRLSRFDYENTSRMVMAFLEISTKPGGFIKKIYDLTAGNPLHIHELLHFMIENNFLSFEQGNWWISDKDTLQQIPLQLQAILEKRYERLSELQKNILQKATFLDLEFSLDDLSTISDKDPLILAEMLDDMVQGNILSRKQDQGAVLYNYNHALFRQLIFQKVKKVDRLKLHLMAANILKAHFEQGNDEVIGQLSHHFQQGGDREKAYHYALIAAQRAQKMLNLEEEIYYLDRALSLHSDKEDLAQRREIFQKLGNAYFRSNYFEKAVEAYEQGAQLINKSKNRDLFLELEQKKGKAFEKLGEFRNAREIYSQALSLLPENDVSVISISLQTRLGWSLSILKEYKEANAVCKNALKTAKSIQEPELIAHTYNIMGKIAEDCADFQKAMNYFRKALRIYRDNDIEIGLALVFNNLGTLADKMGERQKAIEYYRKSLELKRRQSDLPGEANSLSNIATTYGMLGDWEKSLSHLKQALEIFHRIGNYDGQATLHHNLGVLYLRKGEFEEAHGHFNTSLELKEKIEDTVGIANTYLSLASLALRQKEFESATDYLARSQSILKKSEQKRLLAVNYRLSAEVFFQKNNLSYALREINRARKVIEAVGDPVEKGNIMRVLGEIMTQMGDKEKARHAFDESIKLLTAAGADFELGLTFLHLGEENLVANNLRESGFALEKAQEIFAQLSTSDLQTKTEQLRQELNKKLQPYYFSLPSDQEQLKALIHVSHLINSISDPERLLEKILDIIIKAVKADRGAIFLKNIETNDLQPEIIRNLEQETVEDAAQLSHTITRNVALRGEPVYITDTKIDSLSTNSKSVALFGIVSILCVPLKVYDDLLGVVYLDSRSMADIFLEKDLQFVAAFANIAALSIANSLEQKRLLVENNYFRSQNIEMFRIHNIIAKSKKMQNILKIASKIASSSSTVLLSGESGTGKEILARAIHYMGSRKKHMFLPFFCGNAPETIIDSELFGYVKGAFSGAVSNKKGIFEEVHGGTVFLDEIGDVTSYIQAKLLRFLQEREVKPLGSNQIKLVDVRVITATNKNLELEVKKGRFRQDLFYRLKVIHLELPPLRERKEDIPHLAHHFLNKYNEKLNNKVKGFTKKAMERLCDYFWPGNVRELENQIELAVNLAEIGSYIDEGLLNDEVRNIENIVRGVKMSGSLKDVLSHIERELIVSALLENKGNKSKAARRLGVSRQCLNQKLKMLKIF